MNVSQLLFFISPADFCLPIGIHSYDGHSEEISYCFSPSDSQLSCTGMSAARLVRLWLVENQSSSNFCQKVSLCEFKINESDSAHRK